MKIKTPIFIMGSPRSGTTLMRLILNNHSQITIPDETGILALLLSKPFYKKVISFKIKSDSVLCGAIGQKTTSQFNNLPFYQRIGTKRIINSIFESYAKNLNKKYWGEKTPTHFNYIKQIKHLYPNATIIFMIRDPRAVVASSKKYSRQANDFWMSKNITTAINFWKASVDAILTNKKQAIIIKYEDLVTMPQQITQEICQKIGINFESNMLNYYKNSQNNLAIKIKGDIAKWHKETTKPINKNNIYKWKNELSKKDIKNIEKKLEKYMKMFNYEL